VALPPRPPGDFIIPTESEYADDVNFISTDIAYLEHLQATAVPILARWGLTVNIEKTEWTTLSLAADPADRGKEKWRDIKLLGSLLGDEQDIARRMQLSTIAFKIS